MYMNKPPELAMAEAIIQRYKDERKRDKKKNKKAKPRHYSFLETWGMILLFSIPIYTAERFLINHIDTILNGLIPH